MFPQTHSLLRVCPRLFFSHSQYSWSRCSSWRWQFFSTSSSSERWGRWKMASRSGLAFTMIEERSNPVRSRHCNVPVPFSSAAMSLYNIPVAAGSGQWCSERSSNSWMPGYKRIPEAISISPSILQLITLRDFVCTVLSEAYVMFFLISKLWTRKFLSTNCCFLQAVDLRKWYSTSRRSEVLHKGFQE